MVKVTDFLHKYNIDGILSGLRFFNEPEKFQIQKSHFKIPSRRFVPRTFILYLFTLDFIYTVYCYRTKLLIKRPKHKSCGRDFKLFVLN